MATEVKATIKHTDPVVILKLTEREAHLLKLFVCNASTDNDTDGHMADISTAVYDTLRGVV